MKMKKNNNTFHFEITDEQILKRSVETLREWIDYGVKEDLRRKKNGS